MPDNVELIHLATPSGSEPAWKVVVLAGMAPSNSEARRLIQQGAVEVDGSRVTDPNLKVEVVGREPAAAGREAEIQAFRARKGMT